jgi:hypothetical protein
MSEETAGCENCGNMRFDPVDIRDNGDMLLKCRGCGKALLLVHALSTDVPDKDGNVYSKGCIAKIREGLKGAT